MYKIKIINEHGINLKPPQKVNDILSASLRHSKTQCGLNYMGGIIKPIKMDQKLFSKCILEAAQPSEKFKSV